MIEGVDSPTFALPNAPTPVPTPLNGSRNSSVQLMHYSHGVARHASLGIARHTSVGIARNCSVGLARNSSLGLARMCFLSTVCQCAHLKHRTVAYERGGLDARREFKELGL